MSIKHDENKIKITYTVPRFRALKRISMIPYIIVNFLPYLLGEIVKIPLHPLERSDSLLSYYTSYFRPSKKIYMYQWNNRNTSTPEQLINFENVSVSIVLIVQNPP